MRCIIIYLCVIFEVREGSERQHLFVLRVLHIDGHVGYGCYHCIYLIFDKCFIIFILAV